MERILVEAAEKEPLVSTHKKPVVRFVAYGEVLYDHFPEGGNEALIREAMIRQGDHYFGQIRLQFTRQSIERRLRLAMVAVILISLPVIMVIIVGAHFAMRRLSAGPFFILK